MWGWSIGLLLGIGLILTTLTLVRERNRKIQLQTDPRFATVWLAGTTWGPHHVLEHGTAWQKWLNAHNITAFGSYALLHSAYDGEPGGVEFWFDYRSRVSGQDLECHRVEAAAFTDDLGQPYHGYLDFQGKMVGVYLPAYDHAARRLFCTVHWVPRHSLPPYPASTPMVFTVEVPPTPRLLPPADSLPHGSQTFTNKGVSIKISEAQLGLPELKLVPFSGQRFLTFRMQVTGGEIANPYASPGNSLIYSYGNGSVFVRRNGQTSITSISPTAVNSALSGWGPLSITDPYGIELLSGVAGPGALPTIQPGSSEGQEFLWRLPVNGAGKGTDAIRLQFAVRPTHSEEQKGPDSLSDPIPFDLIVPVQAGNEI